MNVNIWDVRPTRSRLWCGPASRSRRPGWPTRSCRWPGSCPADRARRRNRYRFRTVQAAMKVHGKLAIPRMFAASAAAGTRAGGVRQCDRHRHRSPGRGRAGQRQRRRGAGVGGGAAVHGEPPAGPARSQADRQPAPGDPAPRADHDGRGAGPRPGQCAVPPPAAAAGTALPGRAARRTTARVRGAGTLHHGPHPGRGLCQRHRARPARQWSWSSRPGQLLAGTVGGHGKLVPDMHPSSVPTGS